MEQSLFFRLFRELNRSTHGTYIRGQLRYRCARTEQSLLFSLIKAFDQIQSSHTSDFFFSPKGNIHLHACATCSNLPSNIITMTMIMTMTISISTVSLSYNLFPNYPYNIVFFAFFFHHYSLSHSFPSPSFFSLSIYKNISLFTMSFSTSLCFRSFFSNFLPFFRSPSLSLSLSLSFLGSFKIS